MTNIVPDFGTGSTQSQLQPIPFMFDGEVFYAVPETGMGTLFDMSEIMKVEGLTNQINAISYFVQSLLIPESFERLKVRMRDHTKPPVSLQGLMRAIEYIMEQQNDRPTSGSSPSPAPSSTIDMSSTVGAPPTVSTPGV